MRKEIFKLTNDDAGGNGISAITIEARGDEHCYVWVEVEDAEYYDHYIALDQEETLMVAVALLEALKEVWPVYGELEDIISSVLDDIDDSGSEDDETNYEDE